ncbi:ABC transporter ATP-binding protein [Arthrobacter sp. NyZ413]|uniref:ABC transporter ATP-binding protein n=1 Tax=Arthrobacter sp. NyZ413 TaxID=3144669 RepID=UPI002CA1B357|nr:ABC transporter ATP-binding protein [Arthrobacter sp.]
MKTNCQPLLSIREACRNYNDGAGNTKIALSRVDLDVLPGELVAIIGPSGSGKSTLLQIAGGIDSPTTGSVDVAGRRISDMTEKERTLFRREHIGFVFQAIHLVPSMTVVENIGLTSIVSNHRTVDWKAEALVLLHHLGLHEYADKFPDQLSGGQRQRVGVGRAIFGNPSVILADEPTGSLDSGNREIVLKLIRQAIDDGQRTGGLMVTHDLQAASYADRIIAISDGIVVDQFVNTAAQQFNGQRGGHVHDERIRSWFTAVSL